MFSKILIANRGEIACRVIRTARQLGIRTVAVYSDADAKALHVEMADEAVNIGPAPARDSYLRMDAILDAARRTGAEAIHPGYGFLSENTAFAQACADAGVVFVGPPARAVEVMGDKIRAKQTVSRAGVPVVPGRSEPGMTDADLVDAAAEVGFPVLVKPSAGGGGKGMRLVHEAGALREALGNVDRHARAGKVTVRLRRLGSRAVLTVADDGAGFDVPDELEELAQGRHFGVTGMRERAQLAGGDLSVESAPGEGCVLSVWMPVDAPEAKPQGASAEAAAPTDTLPPPRSVPGYTWR